MNDNAIKQTKDNDYGQSAYWADNVVDRFNKKFPDVPQEEEKGEKTNG